MFYRTCQGCAFVKARCEHRDAMRKALAGLSVTSVKWRCKARKPMFSVGDAVWAFTVTSMDNADRYGNDGEPYRDDYPAFVVDMLGTHALVYIAPSAPGRSSPHYAFEGNGFCKLPLSRLKYRDAQREDVCKTCQQPTSAGHGIGHSCNPHFLTEQFA